jgi:molybdopterin-guanine dinucleotide biosynthesis protein A
LILAGGRGRRIGDVDKASLTLGGRTFLERALDAVGGASRVVFVGPEDVAPAGVERVQEDPPGGGPVAGIAAGLGRVSAEFVVVLAVDYPLVDAYVVADLVASVGESDGYVLRDDEGRDQPLAGCYRTESLRSALDALPKVHGVSVREAMHPLHAHSITRIPAAIDCDTPEDLERLESEMRDQ